MSTSATFVRCRRTFTAGRCSSRVLALPLRAYRLAVDAVLPRTRQLSKQRQRKAFSNAYASSASSSRALSWRGLNSGSVGSVKVYPVFSKRRRILFLPSGWMQRLRAAAISRRFRKFGGFRQVSLRFGVLWLRRLRFSFWCSRRKFSLASRAPYQSAMACEGKPPDAGRAPELASPLCSFPKAHGAGCAARSMLE